MSDLVAAGAARFLDAEVIELVASKETGSPVRVAAIGTTAAKAMRGTLLAQAVAGRGFELVSATPWQGPDALFADGTWDLGVVLSPWKQEIGRYCDSLGPSAQVTGVVDSVLRSPVGAIGFNTNTWSAGTALEVVTGGAIPERVLVLGSGASARSVALAVKRCWPRCDLGVAARRPDAAERLGVDFGAHRVHDVVAFSPELVVNTTTWGETEASEAEPFGLDLEGLFAPGGRLFDLNNRIGALQHCALEAGCAVVSGGVMQRVTNACRAALLSYSA